MFCNRVIGDLELTVPLRARISNGTGWWKFSRSIYEWSVRSVRPSCLLICDDNRSALLLADHPVHHSRTQHIAVHYHFTHDVAAAGHVRFEWVSTRQNAADIFTKGGFTREQHAHLCDAIGLCVVREGESTE